MVSVAVLAGGQSCRMGRDKAFLEVADHPIIERVLTAVASLTDDLFISVNARFRYEQFGLRIVPDIYPHKATLGGIYSAICAARYDHVLIVACDMPFLNSALLQHLIELAPTAAAIAPLITPSQPETVHTIYSKSCLPAIQVRLLAHRLRVSDFFEEAVVRYVRREEVAQFDSNFQSFININTPEDWQNIRGG